MYPYLFFSTLTVVLFTAIFIYHSSSLFTIITVSALYSLACTLFYILVGAVDVALTESAIGVGVSTMLGLLTISIISTNKKIKDVKQSKGKSVSIALIITVILVFIIFAQGMQSLPIFGSFNSPSFNQTYFNYIEYSKLYNIDNIVTTILGSFRGYDTMGETLVILIAAVAVVALLKSNPSK